MIKIYDCSNSNERPEHRHNSGGPKENDIIRDLKKYSRNYGFEFVDDYKKSKVIITNDIFPSYIKDNKIPKIKRMDGIYWDNQFIDRNIKLNEAAQIADHVIFISNFSSNSLKELYTNIELKNQSVILNAVDDTIFIKRNLKLDLSFVASCTDWSRPEKRLEDLIRLSSFISEKIYLIGKCDNIKLPRNIIPLGYFDDYEKMAKSLCRGTAFINLSYRDAAPKCVLQAKSCGLPILYADSGGVPELVSNGVSIKDEKKLYFDDKPYSLKIEDMIEYYQNFKQNFVELRYKSLNSKQDYQKTIKKYFDIIKRYV